VSIRYHVVFGKKDEVVEGPDDAELVIVVPAADAQLPPEVAYMRGSLKATGHTGRLFEAFRSGEVAAAVTRLASRP
jgi:hypothetical protein